MGLVCKGVTKTEKGGIKEAHAFLCLISYFGPLLQDPLRVIKMLTLLFSCKICALRCLHCMRSKKSFPIMCTISLNK